jgi:hypothetical protein
MNRKSKIVITITAFCTLIVVNVSVTYAVVSAMSNPVSRSGLIGDLENNLSISFVEEPFQENTHNLGLIHSSMPAGNDSTTAHIYEYRISWKELDNGEILLKANNLKLTKNEEEIEEPEELWTAYISIKLYFGTSEINNAGALMSAAAMSQVLLHISDSPNETEFIFPATKTGYLYAVVTLKDDILSASDIAKQISGAEYTFDVVPIYTAE